MNKNNIFENIYECVTASDGGPSSLNATTPENQRILVEKTDLDKIEENNVYLNYGEELDESEELIGTLQVLNEEIFKAATSNRLKEDLCNEDSNVNLVRYQLQKWTNGGTLKEDGTLDGEKGGPSSYEAWREGIITKKRKERTEIENEDRKRNDDAGVYRTTTIGKSKLLDGQIDDFLLWWMKKEKIK